MVYSAGDGHASVKTVENALHHVPIVVGVRPIRGRRTSAAAAASSSTVLEESEEDDDIEEVPIPEPPTAVEPAQPKPSKAKGKENVTEKFKAPKRGHATDTTETQSKRKKADGLQALQEKLA